MFYRLRTEISKQIDELNNKWLNNDFECARYGYKKLYLKYYDSFNIEEERVVLCGLSQLELKQENIDSSIRYLEILISDIQHIEGFEDDEFLSYDYSKILKEYDYICLEYFGIEDIMHKNVIRLDRKEKILANE